MSRRAPLRIQVCRSANAVSIYQDTERYCFFWIPMCRVGTSGNYAKCGVCGSTMPAAALLQQPAIPVARVV